MNRIEAGFVLVPNRYDRTRLARIELSPSVTDCVVFWTKNPAPLLGSLDHLEHLGYPFYFQFTLTPYGAAWEPGLPPLTTLIETFQKLSGQVGAHRVVWRYDPVIIDSAHSVDWHERAFESLAGQLEGFTRRCVISFVDVYAALAERFRVPTYEEMREVGKRFSISAAHHAIKVATCAEEAELSSFGIGHASCIDRGMVEECAGYPLEVRRDPGQRTACRCCESVDVGAYNTCLHGCVYCYATSNTRAAARCLAEHDPHAPLLTGWPRGDEVIVDRPARSLRRNQLRLFDEG